MRPYNILYTLICLLTRKSFELENVDATQDLLVLLFLLTLFVGVAVGSGWQSTVAYVNLGSYYLLGVPLGFLMGWQFNLGVMVK